MSADRTVRSSSVALAVEIVKAAIPSQGGTGMGYPDNVAKFIEIVAKKIDDLMPR
jgi:hypothetical protein